MRIAIVAALALFLGSNSVLAAGFATPSDLVEAIYDQYKTENFLDYEELYSTDLKDLYEAALDRGSEDEVGPLDFDPFVNAQDFDISNVEIGKPVPAGERTKVHVELDNFGEPFAGDFYLVEESDGWKLDDFESLSSDFPYTLSDIFKTYNTGDEGGELLN